MLLRPSDDGTDATICIGQASHAWICGQLARAWRDVSPREEVVLAAEQHDVGWVDFDLAPELDSERGLPQDFMRVDHELRMAIWERAAYKLASQSLYAALLVSLHGASLRFGLDQRGLQERWMAELGADRDEVERNRRLILALDAISLALCLRWDPYETDGLRLERTGDETFTLRPWPFLHPGPLTVHCEGRRLEGRFSSGSALHAALAAAPLVALRFTLVG